MTTPRHLRITTADSHAAKLGRLIQFLTHPVRSQLSNREIARQAQVDETTVRAWRKKLQLTASKATSPAPPTPKPPSRASQQKRKAHGRSIGSRDQ